MAKKRGKNNFWNKLDSNTKKLDYIDIRLIKLSTATFMFFLITVWPWFKNLIFGVHWAFWLVISLLVMIRPLKRYFSK